MDQSLLDVKSLDSGLVQYNSSWPTKSVLLLVQPPFPQNRTCSRAWYGMKLVD